MWSKVLPLLVREVAVSGLASRSSLTVARSPALAATCRQLHPSLLRMRRSAPASTSARTVASLSARVAANITGVQSARFKLSTAAPAPSSCRTAASWPHCAASCSGVLNSRFLVSTPRPRPSSSLMQDTCPPRAATCSSPSPVLWWTMSERRGEEEDARCSDKASSRADTSPL